MNNLITLSFFPRSYDLGLLLLRVWIGFSLFYSHGLEKITHFSVMSTHFPNPVGIGSTPSLVMALVSDAICSILVMIGFATRWAALYIAIILGTAFVEVHYLKLSGPHNGEVPYLYIGVCLAVFLAGPGRFSIDGRTMKRF